MRRIALTGKRGGYVMVSDEDYDWLSEYKWNHAATGYVCTYKGSTAKKKVNILMHRLILGFPEGLEVDHIDGNRRNNQRHNLRVATRSFNASNMGARYPRGKYGRNVAKMKNRATPYSVQCWKDGKPVHGGYFKKLRDAQAAAAELRKELGYADC